MRILVRGQKEIILPANTLTVRLVEKHLAKKIKVRMTQVEYEDFPHYAHNIDLGVDRIFAFLPAEPKLVFPHPMTKQTRFTIYITTMESL